MEKQLPLPNGTVMEVHPKLCRVLLDDPNTQPLLCSYRRAKVYTRGKQELKERSPVVVGDRVEVKVLGSKDGVIEGIEPRKNELYRHAPGKEGAVIHVLAANVDLLVIVTSVKDPDFNVGIVDRFLIAALQNQIPSMIVTNKVDLIEGRTGLWDVYRSLSMKTVGVSVKTGEGIEELKESIRNKLTVFCGHSGVGKTSILRNILNQDIGKIGAVDVRGKGKHTTSSAVLYSSLVNNERVKVIDTPGIREFSFFDIEIIELKKYFPEFEKYQCADYECIHDLNSENCGVKETPRYQSYLKILETLREK